MPGSPYPKNWMGIAGLIVGIVGLFSACCWGLGIFPGGAGLVFGLLGRKAAQQGEANNGSLATAAFVTGIVAVALNVLLLILIVNAAVSEGVL